MARAVVSRVRAISRSASTGPAVIDPVNLERRRRTVARSFDAEDKRAYFEGVAEARYILRKVFRIVEEQAKESGLDPLAHQALIQIYGSRKAGLRVNELAERLDIAPAFASNLLRALSSRKLISRSRSETDQRAIALQTTEAGRKLLHAIDVAVKVHVDYFTGALTPDDREAALSILMFYVGAAMSI